MFWLQVLEVLVRTVSALRRAADGEAAAHATDEILAMAEPPADPFYWDPAAAAAAQEAEEAAAAAAKKKKKKWIDSWKTRKKKWLFETTTCVDHIRH